MIEYEFVIFGECILVVIVDLVVVSIGYFLFVLLIIVVFDV